MPDKATTTADFIKIGFCQPKFYKPHVWRKAKKIMEWLCDNTEFVARCDFGRGKGKYGLRGTSNRSLDEIILSLANIYDNLNFPR